MKQHLPVTPRKYILRLLLAFIGLVTLSFVLLLGVTSYHQSYLAHKLANGVRNELLIGDYREAMSGLKSAITDDFSRVTFYDFSNTKRFDVSSENDFLLGHLPDQVTVELNPKIGSGHLVFEYNLLSDIDAFLLFWLVAAALNIPISLWIYRYLLQRYELRLQEVKLSQLGRISRQVVHDIRSPLSLIRVLSQNKDIPRAHRDLLKKTSERIELISQDILKLKSVEESSGLLVYQDKAKGLPGINNVEHVVSNALKDKEHELRHKPSVKLELCLSGCDLNTVGDEVSLMRVLSNLINNSVESFEEGGKIIVSVEDRVGDVLIEIRDNGMGIPSDQLRGIFNEGFSYNKPGGTGLGLTYAKKMIEAWGGEVRLFSLVDCGTTVSLVLPKMEEATLIRAPGRLGLT